MLRRLPPVAEVCLACALFLGLTTSINAAVPTVDSLPESALVPGGVAVLKLAAPASSASYNRTPVLVVEFQGEHYAVVGVPLNPRGGAQQLDVVYDNGDQGILWFRLSRKDFAEERLPATAQDSGDAADLSARLAADTAAINAALSTRTDSLNPDFSLTAPVAGERRDSFGLRRYVGDRPEPIHVAMDIEAPAGTPVRAAAPGVVITTGEFTAEGNVVIVDHGQGLLSLYGHLSQIGVTPGTAVTAATEIGQVGQSGQASTPHLHWRVQLNATPVDPALFLAD